MFVLTKFTLVKFLFFRTFCERVHCSGNFFNIFWFISPPLFYFWLISEFLIILIIYAFRPPFTLFVVFMDHIDIFFQLNYFI
ncbi:unnamed protein product [Meloidogyne enterolobii]|uniref:Uncharacterized protein n=1 Tax=Meloidogyne enterolobii TaxID=390850 RepID=A0ACB0Z172_MELEN